MAVTCAVTVANLYYAQPLLHSIGDSLHVSQGAASLLVTAGQLGYAVGLLLIVPAGDITRRRPLLTRLLALCTITLIGCALAPNLQRRGALPARGLLHPDWPRRGASRLDQPGAARDRRAADGRLRAGLPRHQPERHLRPAA
jgi:MFS family permease